MRVLRVLLLTSILTIASIGVSWSGVLAYGHADQPLAQIEFSLNCNNPGFPLCFPPPPAPPPNGFGLGGVWVWIEIDAAGTGDVAGAGCGHIRGVGGGASPILGDITWTSFTGDPLAAGILSFAVDPHDTYYVVTDESGMQAAFPQTVGHYSSHPVPGVAIELQVAP